MPVTGSLLKKIKQKRPIKQKNVDTISKVYVKKTVAERHWAIHKLSQKKKKTNLLCTYYCPF